MKMNLRFASILLMVLASSVSIGNADDDLPLDPVTAAFDAGQVEEGRKLALERLTTIVEAMPDKIEITNLDEATALRMRRMITTLELLDSWTNAEGKALYITNGHLDDKFADNVWMPMFIAAKTFIARLDAAIAQCQKLAETQNDQRWLAWVKHWRNYRDNSLTRLSLLAKIINRPDLVKAVFEFGGPCNGCTTAEQFLVAKQDVSSWLNYSLARPLPEADEKQFKELLNRWVTAVEKKDREALQQLYADPGQADRLVENGLFDSFKFRQVNVFAGKLLARKTGDNSLYLILECPAKNPSDLNTRYCETFSSVRSQGVWKFVNPHDDGLSLAQKDQIKKLIETWAAAMMAEDVEKAAGLCADPAEARGKLPPHMAKYKDVRIDLTNAKYEIHRGSDGTISVECDYVLIAKDSNRKADTQHVMFHLVFMDNQFKIAPSRKN